MICHLLNHLTADSDWVLSMIAMEMDLYGREVSAFLQFLSLLPVNSDLSYDIHWGHLEIIHVDGIAFLLLVYWKIIQNSEWLGLATCPLNKVSECPVSLTMHMTRN